MQKYDSVPVCDDVIKCTSLSKFYPWPLWPLTLKRRWKMSRKRRRNLKYHLPKDNICCLCCDQIELISEKLLKYDPKLQPRKSMRACSVQLVKSIDYNSKIFSFFFFSKKSCQHRDFSLQVWDRSQIKVLVVLHSIGAFMIFLIPVFLKKK